MAATAKLYLIAVLAQVLGGSSLLLLGVFLFRGPFHVVDFGFSTFGSLGFDGFLCIVFCLQHSVMVRKSLRKRMSGFVRDYCYGAVYAIASGLVLTIMLVLWQGAIPELAGVYGIARWILRAVTMLAMFCMVWGILALGSFDAFGVRPLMAEVSGREIRDMPLDIRGPYRWVRHPLYACVLLLLWSCPDLSADRLLLNIVWSVWVVIATKLEERDLVYRFGEPYRKYQRDVPMLIPWRVLRLKGER